MFLQRRHNGYGDELSPSPKQWRRLIEMTELKSTVRFNLFPPLADPRKADLLTHHVSQGLTLFHFAFLVLAIGNRSDYLFEKEPLPGDVIDLVHEHVHKHPELYVPCSYSASDWYCNL
jgi:hypothetical protein